MSNPSLATRFGNASCPAVQSTYAYNPNSTHAACYGPYATGESGANITRILGQCCHGLSNETAPVQVVYDQSIYGPPLTDCWYRCEAPWIENITETQDSQPDNGQGFYRLEQCIKSRSLGSVQGLDNGTDSYNPYFLQCLPKTSKTKTSDGDGAGRILGVSMWAIGFLGLLVVPLLSV